MEHLAEQFVRVRKAQGLGGRGRRYPESLRRLAVEYGRWVMASGGSVEDAAQALGVSPPTLVRWLDQDDGPLAAPVMHEVTLVDEGPSSPSGELVVWTPDGFRIEGIHRSDLAGVLEALRG